MFYKRKYAPVAFYCVPLMVILGGCAKETTTRVNTTSNQTNQTTIATDELVVNNELGQFVDDAILVLSNHNATITNAFVDSVNPHVIEITYIGKEPDGVKIRSGVDSIHINSNSWGSPGATATLSFKDINSPTGYEIQFYSIISPLIDSASLTFAGSVNITNTNGVLLQNITSSDSLVVHVKSTNISFTFNDQAAVLQLYPLNVNESRSFKLSDTTVLATTWGDTAINGSSNVSDWGTNRYGNTYYSVSALPTVQNISNLNLSYNPLSGSKTIEGISEPISITYGVNNQGNVIISGMPYGFLTAWINNGGQATAVVRYYY